MTLGLEHIQATLERLQEQVGARTESGDAEERRLEQDYELERRPYRAYDDRGVRVAGSLEDVQTAPHNEEAIGLCKQWLDDTDPNLILVGPIGCGKSYVAGGVAGELGKILIVTMWVNAASMMARIRRGFSDRDEARNVHEQMRLAEKAPVLVLDDLGKVHPGKDVSWVEEQFYALVDARYRQMLPTIITTEWKRTGLAERVGESVVSRLIDGAWVAQMKRPEAPYRREAL